MQHSHVHTNRLALVSSSALHSTRPPPYACMLLTVYIHTSTCPCMPRLRACVCVCVCVCVRDTLAWIASECVCLCVVAGTAEKCCMVL